MHSPAPFRRWLYCTILCLATGILPAQEPRRLGLFVIDIEKATVTPVASEPLDGHAYCGTPEWSPDGKRILFDATPGNAWSKTHLIAADFPVRKIDDVTDFGPGNCPAWSPDGKQVAFMLNPGAVPNAEPGIWIMDAKGENRRRLAAGAMPKWSPDGKRILSVSFSNPRQLSIIDVEKETSQSVDLPGHEFVTTARWAGDGETLITVVRENGPLSIALVDVSRPGEAKIKRTLWTRGDRSTVSPMYPDYSAKTKRCVFVGWESQGSALYVLGADGPPRRIEKAGFDVSLASLALSPDGGKILFCSDRNVGERSE